MSERQSQEERAEENPEVRPRPPKAQDIKETIRPLVVRRKRLWLVRTGRAAWGSWKVLPGAGRV